LITGEVVEQQRVPARDGRAEVVQVRVLAAMVRPQPDEVALVGDHVVELECLKKPRTAE
jgi:hypothetical protein